MECPICRTIHSEVVLRCKCGHQFAHVFRLHGRLIIGRPWPRDPRFNFIDRPARPVIIEKGEFDDIELI